MGRGIAQTTIMLIITAATIMTLINDIASETHVVGDDNGWDFPPSPSYYKDWADQHSFSVGDILVFNFETEDHTVAILKSEESEAVYDECNTGLIKESEIMRQGPLNITLTSSGQFYFLCTIGRGRHCKLGLKFAARVAAAGS